VAVSSSSSALRARQELAERLREIRLDANLTGRVLSAAAGWHGSKTSRIESAKQVPSDADIRLWCQICDVGDLAADLVAASRIADSMYIEWRRLQRTGLRRLQNSPVPLYERTHLFRVYCSSVVPGFFQTSGYAGALLSAITDFYGTVDNVDDVVAVRMNRNRIVNTGDHRFSVVLEESVLRHQIGDPDVMASQLRHLMCAMTLPSVSLGVIPLSIPRRPMWMQETFNIFDDARVHVDLLSALVTVTAPSEVALYVRAFGKLTELAVYGSQAHALITAAISAQEQITPQVSDAATHADDADHSGGAQWPRCHRSVS
jgi:transcriptional regulator with XRE-family HTH domain